MADEPKQWPERGPLYFRLDNGRKQFNLGAFNKAKAASIPFEDRYIPEPMSGCWLWLGGLDRNGYGQILHAGDRHYRAHRLSWERSKGEIPDGLFVLHKCDVRCCVNPDHLFLGTQAENMADMVKKGRQGYGGNYVLSDDQVREIRRLFEDGSTDDEIAFGYGVTAAHINRIRRGVRRYHVH